MNNNSKWHSKFLFRIWMCSLAILIGIPLMISFSGHFLLLWKRTEIVKQLMLVLLGGTFSFGMLILIDRFFIPWINRLKIKIVMVLMGISLISTLLLINQIQSPPQNIQLQEHTIRISIEGSNPISNDIQVLNAEFNGQKIKRERVSCAENCQKQEDGWIISGNGSLIFWLSMTPDKTNTFEILFKKDNNSGTALLSLDDQPSNKSLKVDLTNSTIGTILFPFTFAASTFSRLLLAIDFLSLFIFIFLFSAFLLWIVNKWKWKIGKLINEILDIWEMIREKANQIEKWSIEIPFSLRISLFILSCLVIGYFQIGNFHARLGDIHGDDAPPSYSYLYAFPERYSKDLISIYGSQQTFSTLQNWLPALLYRYSAVSPEISSLIITYLQFLLLGLAIRRFSIIVTKREIIGWFAAFFIFSAKPFSWNLANYGSMMTMPYAGHFVLPFLLMAFSDLVEGRNLRLNIWLFLGGLIHPSLTTYAIAMIAVYWVIEGRLIRNKFGWFALILVSLSVVLPRLLLNYQDGAAALLSFNEMKLALLENQHMQPISLNYRSEAFLFFIPLLILAIRDREYVVYDYLKVLISVSLVCVFFVLLSWIAWKFEILMLIQLIPQRSSALLVFIGLPIFLLYIVRNLEYGGIAKQIVSGLITYQLAFQNYKYFLNSDYLILPTLLLMLDFLSGNIGPIKFELPGIWLKRINAYFQKEFNVSRPFMNAKLLVPITLLLLAFVTFHNSWEEGSLASNAQAIANYDAQVWARDHLPTEAMVIDMSRSVSQRSSVSPIPYDWYVYNRLRSCKDYIDKMKAFYLPYKPEVKPNFYQYNFKDEDIIQFSKAFGGDYILRLKSHPLGFTKVYQNEFYTLYKLPDSQK